MLRTIQNDFLTFVSDDFNVEPWVLRFNDEESNYFWRPPEIEKIGAAVCFPLLGSLPDDRYTLDGREYSMPNHGFAKLRRFDVAQHETNSIVYEIRDDEQSRMQYPYAFRFQVAYILQGTGLRTEYRVENLSDDVMYFSAGGHPRYACPVDPGSEAPAFADHYLEFAEAEQTQNIVKSYGPVEVIERFMRDGGRRLRLDHSMFEKGCFCYHPFHSREVVIKNSRNSRGLRVSLGNITHLQIWNAPGKPFVCLEPWYGSITSIPPKAEESDWKQRKGTLRLLPGEKWIDGYTVEPLR